MKPKSAEILVVACGLFAFGPTLASRSTVQSSAANQARRPVVVELFTSEGCSTCPPADELLVRLEEQQSVDGAEVIAIEEHVDYWNHAGWTDPFSASEWTLRQEDYSARFKLDGVYTPQMVIDGREQFIGSRIQEVAAAVKSNSQLPKAQVAITETSARADQPRQFGVSVADMPGATAKDARELWFAVTEKGLNSQVNRGENAGKTLHHASIVRWMRRIAVANGKGSAATFTAKAELKLKPAWKVENLRAVAFVQERQSRRIIGAASIKISSPALQR